MKKINGFTLIEILVALSIFAIIASITASSLYYAFTTRTRVNASANRFNAIELAISLIQQDTTETVQRSVLGNDMHVFPIFVGQNQYMEFTRDGVINPQSIEKRSTQERIAYVCKDDNLYRRTWLRLDSLDRNQYEDKILIDKLKDCQFEYLNAANQVLSEWRPKARTQEQRNEPLPKAVRINVTLSDLGEMNLLFILPGGLYAAKKTK